MMLIRLGPRDSALLFMHTALWLVILGQTNIIAFTWLNTKRWLDWITGNIARWHLPLCAHTHKHRCSASPATFSCGLNMPGPSVTGWPHTPFLWGEPLFSCIFLLFSLIGQRLDLPIGTTLLIQAAASFSSVPFSLPLFSRPALALVTSVILVFHI